MLVPACVPVQKANAFVSRYLKDDQALRLKQHVVTAQMFTFACMTGV